ncbi:integrase core domain-containing protein [Empedobacter sp.]|uniref:integrase core domain-containing protein n=1 Tax=Empedobacter sp. TaxID=1927715 RepID=UPI0028AB53FA|nr:integrase core domain-containing protein [Empedobacter sp.]
MIEKGDPYENAMAERVNGMIKMEFNLYESSLGFDQTKIKVNNSLKSYNELRPQVSCDYLTPNAAHLQSEKLKKKWKNYNRSFNYQNSLV